MATTANAEKAAEEKTPLLKTGGGANIRRGYQKGAACTILVDDETGMEQIVDYDAECTSTIRVLFMRKGTVLANPVLWTEQLIIVLAFAIPTCGFMWLQNDTVKSIVESKGGDITSFTTLMSKLAAFLLGFYTSLSVGRWWRLRCSGVGSIWSSSSQLSLLISQMATRDEQVLSAIRRYARASLAIVFLKRTYGAENLKENLRLLSSWKLLTEEEVDKLQSYNNNLAESIWTWNVNIVTQLYKQGLIKSAWQYNFILEKAMIGRSGAAVIGAQMGTPIPFMYVHLLGCLVKLHNLFLALVMSMFMAYTIKQHDYFAATQLIGRVFLLPFFYNALIMINQDLSDPFSGDVTDFPMAKYQKGIEGDGRSYVEAGEHLPQWLGKEFQDKKIESV